MRSRKMAILGMVAFLCVPVPAALALEGYTYTDLGTSFYAYAINDVGQVAGNSSISVDKHMVLYSGGLLQDLGDPTAGASVRGISNAGQVVGTCQGPDGFQHGFLYSGGQMQLLPSIAGGRQTYAYAINEGGQIAGSSEVYYERTLSIFHACVYDIAGIVDLGNLRGTTYDRSYAYAINDLGQVVGSSEGSFSGSHAVLFSDGQVQDLGTVPGDAWSCARGINNAGQIVGWSATSNWKYHACLYSGGQMQYLGTLPGCTQSYACGVNNIGQIVGWAQNDTSGTAHAFLYTGGQMLDLGVDLMNTITSGAIAINDAGQIAGHGLDGSGQEHGFLLTPTPEPATLSMLALGGLALLRRRRCAAPNYRETIPD